MMKISVVIPNYNKENTIKKCIESIYLQRKDIEIIVVDDCSEDKSLKIMKKSFPKVKIIRNTKNRGAAYCRNLGVLRSSGDYIAFVDSDVCLKKNCLNQLLKSIKHADISFPTIIYENKSIMYPLIKEEQKYPMISACFMIKRKSIKKLDEMFDKNYRTFNEDSDFFLRCRLFGLKAGYSKNALAVHMHKSYDTEKRYYLENKNIMYGIIKFKGLTKGIKFKHPFKVQALLKNLVCGIFNFNWFDWSSYKRNKSFLCKIQLLTKKHKKITNKPAIILPCLFLKAILWNIVNLNKALIKRKSLKNCVIGGHFNAIKESDISNKRIYT